MINPLRLSRFHSLGGPVHAVALSGDGDHLLVGSEHGLQLLDRRGNVQCRLERHGAAFSRVGLSPRLDAGIALERAGRLYRLDFRREASDNPHDQLRVAAVGIWEQQDDLYSLDFAPQAGAEREGLIALGHHALGLTLLDGRGQLLWRLGPQEGTAGARRTWHATISPDCRTIYAAALGGAAPRTGEIVAIDAALGKPGKSIVMAGRVTLLASLPAPLAVAAVIHTAAGHDTEASPGSSRLVGLDAGLRGTAWSLACPPGVTITALQAVPGRPVLVAGTNTGELWQIGAFTGRVTARCDLLFASTVLSVAVAATGEIAAGLANGRVAFLEHEDARERK